MTQHWAVLLFCNNTMLVVIIYESAFVERSLFLGGSPKRRPCLMPLAGSKLSTWDRSELTNSGLEKACFVCSLLAAAGLLIMSMGDLLPHF